MKHTALGLALAASVLAPAVDAGPRPADLAVSITPPASSQVDQLARYSVRVDNVGGSGASAVSLTIQLPTTNTSPTSYIMGTLGPRDSRCTVQGTRLVCALGSLSRARGTTVNFEIALPYSAGPLNISASATHSISDPTPSNNNPSIVASPSTVALAVTPPRQTLVRHCTGTNLTSFFECELFPSSLSEHETILEPGGSVTILNNPGGYTGTWTQPAANRLRVEYFDGGQLAATFEGYGVDGSCFEGRTTFPGSTYVSMYQLCLR